MAAIDFPASPATGQLFVAANGVTYQYNGTLWLVTAGPGGGTGDFSTNQRTALPTLTATPTTLKPTQNIVGNTGTWYATGTGRYTPPAGRFLIIGSFTAFLDALGTMILDLRKNGTIVQSSADAAPAANYFGNPIVSLIVDANGTDWWDIQGSISGGVNATINSLTFQAFPLTGMQGPQGAPPTAGGGIIREVTLSSPAATIDFFNLGVKTVDIYFHLGSVAAAANFYIQSAVGSTPNAGAAYNYVQVQTSGGSTVGVLQTGLTALDLWINSFAGAIVTGNLRIPNLPSILNGTGEIQGNIAGGGYYLLNKGFQGPAGDGFRLTCVGSSFMTGSFVRVVGWP